MYEQKRFSNSTRVFLVQYSIAFFDKQISQWVKP